METLKLLPEQVTTLQEEAAELNKQYLKLLEEKKQDEISISDRFHSGHDSDYLQKLTSILDRIKTIYDYLRCYELVEGYDSEKISIGTEFSVYMDFGNDETEKETYKLVHTNVSASKTRNYISMECNLGDAVLNKKVGDHIHYLTPAKKEVNGIILDILPEKVIDQPKEKSLIK